MLLTSLVLSIFHVVHLEVKTCQWLSKDLMQVGLTAMHGYTGYDESKDLAFCFLCMKAVKKISLVTSWCADKPFISRGLSNWKDVKVAFRKHEQTKCHKEAVQTVAGSFVQRF